MAEHLITGDFTGEEGLQKLLTILDGVNPETDTINLKDIKFNGIKFTNDDFNKSDTRAAFLEWFKDAIKKGKVKKV